MKRWPIRVAVFVGVAALVGAVAWLLVAPPAPSYLDEIARLRAAGEPVDFVSLADPAVLTEQNGALDLVDACKWLDDNVPAERWKAVIGPWNYDYDAPDDWREKATAEQWAELTRFADELGPFFDRVRAGSMKPRIQFRGQPDETGFPSSRYTLTLLRVWHTSFAAMAGASEAGRRLDAIEALAAIGAHLECHTFLDHHMAAGSREVAIAELRRQLEASRVDASAARSRLDPHLREESCPRLPSIVRAERVFWLQAGRAHDEGTWSYPEKRSSKSAFQRAWDSLRGRESDESSDPFARDWGPFIAAANRCLVRAGGVPYSSFGAYRAAIVAAMHDEGTDANEFETSYLPVLDRVAQQDAASRLTRIALAVAEHRARHGDFPASLDEMKWAFPDRVPSDPFTDAPFIYERTATGARISSLGRLPEQAPLDDATLRERSLLWELKR